MRHRIVLHGNDREFPRLVEFAENFAERCRLPEAERSRLLVILEELFTNTVRYGYPADQPGRIEVALRTAPGRIEIDFSDDGQPFDPLTYVADPVARPPGERANGGRGLKIVRGLVDEARYRRAGGRNWLALVRRLAPSR